MTKRKRKKKTMTDEKSPTPSHESPVIIMDNPDMRDRISLLRLVPFMDLRNRRKDVIPRRKTKESLSAIPEWLLETRDGNTERMFVDKRATYLPKRDDTRR